MTKNAELLADKIDALGVLMRGIEDDHYPTALDRVQGLRMIRETADSALQQAVNQARDEGETWEKIARYLDVTTQAAHKRYAGPISSKVWGDAYAAE